MGFIYQILNAKTGKCYIGQSRQSNTSSRWSQHKHQALVRKSTSSALYDAMRSYGIDFFKYIVILEDIHDDELNTKEIEFIKSFNSIVPNGYNIKEGGDHTPHSEETKRKIGEKSKGRQCNLGRVFSDEWKKNIGNASRGRKFSEITKAQLKESHANWHKSNPIAHKNCKYSEDDIRYIRTNPDNLSLNDFTLRFKERPYRIQRIIDNKMYKYVT